MLESVQILLQVTVPAAITAGALIWQNIQNNKREDRRREEDQSERQKDREHQTAEANAERRAQQDRAYEDKRAAVEERWRDQRLEAHTNLLDLISQRNEQCRANILKLDLASTDYEHQDNDALLAEINAANARVQLLASKSSAAAAEYARDKCVLLDMQVWTAIIVRGPYGNHDPKQLADSVTRAKSALEAAKTALEAYRGKARADLGTD